MNYIVCVFEASDSGYSTEISVLTLQDAKKACKEWCERNEIKHDGLKDYEETDDNGFFYSFSVVDAVLGETISTGQWR